MKYLLVQSKIIIHISFTVCIHPEECDESETFIEVMRERYKQNPHHLNIVYKGVSVAHEVVIAGHSKCLDFVMSHAEDIPRITKGISIVDASRADFPVEMLKVMRKYDLLGVPKTYAPDCVPSCFYDIIEMNSTEILHYLMDIGVSPEPTNESVERNKVTPMSCAIFELRPKCFQILLLAGAKPKVFITEHNSQEYMEYPAPVAMFMGLSPDMKELVLSMLKRYKQLGGNLWLKAERDLPLPDGHLLDGNFTCQKGQNALEFIKSNPDLLAKLPAGIDKELHQLMTTPPSLKDVCRTVIAKSMGNGYRQRNVKELGLPRELERFLNFKE
jgi:hypothetical protein